MNPLSFSIRIKASGKTLVAAEDYAVHQNEITFLFGESGIGKSLLSKAVYGLLDSDELDIDVNGKPYANHQASAWTQAVQKSSFFVFQEPSSHLNPLLRISEQLSEGSLSADIDTTAILRHLWDTADADAVNRVLNVYPKPFRPSGGEKQRSLLAMAFKKIALFGGGTPSFFVFDEPTGSLDNHYRNLFLKLLFEEFNRAPFTIMVITHDYSIISEVYGRYESLVQKIHFQELSRMRGTQTALRDFSPQEYLGWLSSTPSTVRTTGEKEIVLRFRSNFSIFGRALRIFKDARKTQPMDLIIRKGETVYVKAQSGVGKTTLAKIIMGLYEADAFSMSVCGETLTEKSLKEFWRARLWGKRMGMVFQHADEALNLQATVYETFAGLPLKTPLTRTALKEWLGDLFQGEITEDFLDKKTAYLSGGQKQRLNVLRTLVLDTDLIILDEPLNGLDFVSIKKVLALLEEKRKAGKAMLMISHNEEIFDTLVMQESVYYLGE